MEIVGAAGSVAGLLGLAGQCVDGAITLRTFWQDIKAASTTAAQFLNDLNALIRTLTDINKLLQSIQDEPRLRDHAFDAVTLQLHLEGCDTDLHRWIAMANKSRPDNGKGIKHWFKSFIMAMDKETLRDIRWEMQSRRQCLDLAMGVLGRALDIQNLLATKTFHDTTTLNQAQLLDALKALQDHSDRLDSKFDAISQRSFGDRASLQTTASVAPSALRSRRSSVSLHSAYSEPVDQSGLWPGVKRMTPQQQAKLSRRSFGDEPEPYFILERLRDISTDFWNIPDVNLYEDPNEMPLFQRHRWDTEMLTEWTDSRDRINKWMLHQLGVDSRQARLHRDILTDELQNASVSLDEVIAEGDTWERSAFQFWMIDEAALGADLLQLPRAQHVDTMPSLGPPSLRTTRSSQDSIDSAKRNSMRRTEYVKDWFRSHFEDDADENDDGPSRLVPADDELLLPTDESGPLLRTSDKAHADLRTTSEPWDQEYALSLRLASLSIHGAPAYARLELESFKSLVVEESSSQGGDDNAISPDRAVEEGQRLPFTWTEPLGEIAVM